MPAPKKPDERRQRGRSRGGAHPSTGAEVVPIGPTQVVSSVAAADLAWRDEVQEQWAELWSSPLSGVVKPTDLPALRRLFLYRSKLLDAQDRFDEEPMVPGSMGQPVMSPWAAEVHRLEATVQKLEDRCGLTPMSRLRLGITFEEGVSLAQRNAQLIEAFRQASS